MVGNMEEFNKIQLPPEAGQIVSMVEFNGTIYVAFQYGIYVLKDETFHKVLFEEDKT